MPTTDDDIVHLYERCVDAFGRWAATTLMRLLGPPAYVLDRRLGPTWRHADVDHEPGPSEVVRRSGAIERSLKNGRPAPIRSLWLAG